VPNSTFPSHVIIEEPEHLRGNYEDSLNEKFVWTDEFKSRLQNWRSLGEQEIQCVGKYTEERGGIVSYPKDYVEFVPTSFCR